MVALVQSGPEPVITGLEKPGMQPWQGGASGVGSGVKNSLLGRGVPGVSRGLRAGPPTHSMGVGAAARRGKAARRMTKRPTKRDETVMARSS